MFGTNTHAQLTIIDDEQFLSLNTRARPVIAAGYYHTVALKADGSLWTWGSGYLGLGDLSFATVPTPVGPDLDWATVAIGGSHTLAVKMDGSLWSWGYGSLGLGDLWFANVPMRIGTDTDWAMVAAGVDHSLGLKTNGSLWAWGGFNSTNQPAPIGTDLDWAWIGAGWRRACRAPSP